ncbi:Manganese/iron superoxide dismutase [Phyllosticta capitalensis]
MIPARLPRQLNPLRTAARCSQRTSQVSQRRGVLTPPALLNNQTKFEENGIGTLMSAQGFKTAWTDNMDLLTGRLNKLIKGNAHLDNKEAKDIVVLTARNPAEAAIFNFASAVFNNHFFFNTLLPEKPETPQMDDHLVESITRSFGSIDNLRKEMLATAFHMFGPGFVWLVWHRPTDGGPPGWKILATYLAGSPLSDAHWRRQSVNMTNENIDSANDVTKAGQEARAKQVPGGQQHTEVQNNVGAMGQHSFEGRKQATRAPGGADIIPSLCVNTWEHAWLPTHGIGGKARYLATWWDHIDWATVSKDAPRHVTGSNSTSWS